MSEAIGAVDRLGQVLGGKYRLVRLIGAGGVGEVYHAENTWTGGQVAVKLLRSGFDSDPELWQRFMREARAAAQITHPNVVSVLDLGHDASSSCIFMVQELLQGQTLRDRLNTKGRLPLLEALDVAIPIMGALATAHDHGVLHRDLKPENIFLAQRPSSSVVPKLIDFGVSKTALASAAADLAAMGAAARPGVIKQHTLTGVTLGTPYYMAPEQLRADRDLDGRLDVWAMGVVLYEVLSGQRPFDGPNLLALGGVILEGLAEPLSQVAPDVPESVGAIVHRALKVDREQRFADMPAFVDALLDCPEVTSARMSTAPVRRYRSAVLWRADEAPEGWESTATALDLEPARGAQAASASPSASPSAAAPDPVPVAPVASVAPLSMHPTSTHWPAPPDVGPGPLVSAASTPAGHPEELEVTPRPDTPDAADTSVAVAGDGAALDPEGEATRFDDRVPEQGHDVSQRLSDILVESRLSAPTEPGAAPAPAASTPGQTQPPAPAVAAAVERRDPTPIVLLPTTEAFAPRDPRRSLLMGGAIVLVLLFLAALLVALLGR